MIRCYSDLQQIDSFRERFSYLSLDGNVGVDTFGHDRWINQRFYKSKQWRDLRDFVIARDEGCDLGILGYEVFSAPHIHHMNPMRVGHIMHGDESILDPEYLITTSHQTHNAIHYGDANLLPQPFVERQPGDTKLW